MNDVHAWRMAAVIAAVTALTRFLPFLVFGGEKKPPQVV